MQPRLIYASSEQDADLFYATRFFAPDPFLFLQTGRQTVALMNDLEIDRARAAMRVDEVAAWSEIADRLPPTRRRPADVIAAFLRARKIRAATVPASFPLGLAQDLRKRGIRLRAQAGTFFPERLLKNAADLQALRHAHRITEAGLARAIEVLKASRPHRHKLVWNGRRLTSELLRGEIESAIVRAGGVPTGAIVAGADQACDPHERGHGPLRPNSLIVLDVFPRDARTGFFGDLTRTVVRGSATEAQRRLWHTVRDALKMALHEMRPGTDGKALQERVKEYFARQGYPTEVCAGRHTGFFHGLGHALGLEVHDPLRLSEAHLQPGHVFTVEPGLYYPGLGGVRHEDVVAITAEGHRKLSRFPHVLEV